MFNEFFRAAGAGKIGTMIVNGRISPWVLYNCDSGIACLERFNEEQVALVFDYIDPEYWQNKFRNYMIDAEYIKEACKLGGL